MCCNTVGPILSLVEKDGFFAGELRQIAVILPDVMSFKIWSGRHKDFCPNSLNIKGFIR